MLLPLPLSIVGSTLTAGYRILKQFKTFNSPRETGSLPSVRLHSERNPERESGEERNILDAVQRNPRASTRRLARRCGITQSTVWRTLNGSRLHPYHLQKVQYLQPGDPARRLDL
jgi:hypothetical protein